jgi:hypothetical protein
LEAANPGQRNVWQKLRNMDRKPRYEPALERPITFPVFEASATWRENMLVLLELIATLDKPEWLPSPEWNSTANLASSMRPDKP